MPFRFNGCGTAFHGQRDIGPDGSYITTLWITAVWVPLIPLRSYRVLPVGKGTNIIVHQSQNYQTVRVPLCWPQVRNVFCFTVPILAVVLYFNAADIQKWFKEDVLKTGATQATVLSPEPVAPADADPQLDAKAAAVACGKTLKLDKNAFVKLDLKNHLDQIVSESGITTQDITAIGDTPDSLNNQEFEAYDLGYVTWEKASDLSRTDFDKLIIKTYQSVDTSKLSPNDKAQLDSYLAKTKTMMVKAFELGRHDAKMSPCPY